MKRTLEKCKTLNTSTEKIRKDLEVSKERSSKFNELIIKHEQSINITTSELNRSKEKISEMETKLHSLTVERDMYKSNQDRLNKEYELILTKFEQDLKANTNETVIQNELKLNLKQFYENLFVKTCLFVVNKSNDDFKLIVLNMGTDIKDFNLKNIIKSLLK